jgi:hypothetical protein
MTLLNVHPEDAALAQQLLADAEQAIRGARWESSHGYHVTAKDSIDAARATLDQADALLTPKAAPAAEERRAA